MLLDVIPILIIVGCVGIVLFLLFRRLPEASEVAQEAKRVKKQKSVPGISDKVSIKKRIGRLMTAVLQFAGKTFKKVIPFVGNKVSVGVGKIRRKLEKRKQAKHAIADHADGTKDLRDDERIEKGIIGERGSLEETDEKEVHRGIFGRKKQEVKVELNEKSTSELFVQSKKLLKNKKYKKAEDVYIELVTRDAKDAKAYIGLGRAMYEQENLKDAKAAFDEAILADSSSAESYYYVGRILYKQEFYKRSLNAFNQAVLHDDKDPEKWYYLGRAYKSLNQHKQALKSFLEAQRISPESTVYIRAIISSYKKIGTQEKVAKFQEKLQKLKTEPKKSKAKLRRGSSVVEQ